MKRRLRLRLGVLLTPGLYNKKKTTNLFSLATGDYGVSIFHCAVLTALHMTTFMCVHTVPLAQSYRSIDNVDSPDYYRIPSLLRTHLLLNRGKEGTGINGC